MAKDKQVLVRLTEEQNEALQEFAEDRDYNKSEAGRKILVSRLVGDGYLEEGILLADGGIHSELDRLGSQLQEHHDGLDNNLSQIEQKVERRSILVKEIFILLAGMIVWLTGIASGVVPTSIILAFGTLLLVASLLLYINTRGERYE